MFRQIIMFEDFTFYLNAPPPARRRFRLPLWLRGKKQRPPLSPHLLRDIGLDPQ